MIASVLKFWIFWRVDGIRIGNLESHGEFLIRYEYVCVLYGWFFFNLFFFCIFINFFAVTAIFRSFLDFFFLLVTNLFIFDFNFVFSQFTYTG